jgi:hypothetical protein
MNRSVGGRKRPLRRENQGRIRQRQYVDKSKEEEKGKIIIEKGQEVDKGKYKKSATR